MNQFYQENLLRDYPLALAPSRPANQKRWFLDAGFRISASLGAFLPGVRVYVSQIFDVIGDRIFELRMGGGAAPDVFFISDIVTPQPYLRVNLTLVVDGDNRPDLGFGFLILGSTASDYTPGAYGPDDHPFHPGTTRLLDASPALQIRVANTPCPEDTDTAETPGPEEIIAYRGWVTDEIPRCVEISVYPPDDPSAGNPRPQNTIVPDDRGTTVVPEPVPPPAGAVSEFTPGTVTEISLRPLTVEDTIPNPPAWDAEVIGGGPLGPGLEFVQGFNTTITGDINDPTVTINFGLGAGEGFSCEGHPCEAGLALNQTVRSIAGVYGPEIEFIGGQGVDVLPSPGDHRIYLVFKSERLTSAII